MTEPLSTPTSAPADLNVDPGMAQMLEDFGVEATAEAEPKDPEVEPEAEPAEPAEPETPEPADVNQTLEAQKANQAFAEMRTRNASYSKFIKHMMESSGFTGTEEEYMKVLTDQAYTAKAKNQNVADPAILKRLDELESERAILREQNSKQLFFSNVEKLKMKYNLSDNDVVKFVQDAQDRGIDLTLPGTDFNIIYQGLNHDKIVEKAKEEARQEWLAAQAKGQSQATTPDGKSGKKDPTPTDVNTMAEFNSLLSNLPK